MPLTLLDRLQRRFGRYAIPNLTLLLIAGQAALYLASLLPQGIALERIALDPAKVMRGEVWRLGTFLFTPPGTRPLFVLFYFMLFHLFGTTLEEHWGSLKYNLFIATGWAANVVAAFVASAVVGGQFAAEGEPLLLASIPASNAFLYSSLFLAFARLYPDFTLNLFYILPMRIKWLALLQWATYGYLAVRGPWMVRMLIVATVLNYLLFFGRAHLRDLRRVRRRSIHATGVMQAKKAAKHACLVCGLTSEESPRTLFRYCSKCAGQRCYCPDHIRDHEHVTDG